jgi:hypothetical protein
MAKIRDFLDELKDKSYTDEQLRKRGGDFGLNEDQLKVVTSHDIATITAEIDKESGRTPKGRLLRVVM